MYKQTNNLDMVSYFDVDFVGYVDSHIIEFSMFESQLERSEKKKLNPNLRILLDHQSQTTMP